MLVDSFGRKITYLRLSLTDRCNFRCTYCMPEKMTFSPRSDNLNLDELRLVASTFVALGVKKIRLTGGEPMIHPDFPALIRSLNGLNALEHIAITTNGSLIEQHIGALRTAKVHQLNISLDSLNPDTFAQMTRQKSAMLNTVIAGIDRAITAGIPRIRLNTVINKNTNEKDIFPLIEFARDRKIHIAFIEEMPLGNQKHFDRKNSLVTTTELKQRIRAQFPIKKMIRDKVTSGPADYYLLDNGPTEIGFISPHSNNFCHACNRVRVTRTGQLILCLGNDNALNLREVIQQATNPVQALKNAIIDALRLKPESHTFDTGSSDTQVIRFMNATGG